MRGNFIPALIVCLLTAAPVLAQQHREPAPGRRGPAPLYVPQHREVQRNPNAHQPVAPRTAAPQTPAPSANSARSSNQQHQVIRGQGPHNGDWLRNSMGLSQEEQKKRLQQDPQFRQLPPQRQEQLVNRLQKFDSMTPQERQRVLNRMEMIEHLPPEQQRRANQLFGEFRQLPPERKQAVRQALHQMHTMPPDARLRLLSSPELRARFSPQEIQMLYGFNGIGFVD
jgi:DNA-directed RNA polymerase subunit F